MNSLLIFLIIIIIFSILYLYFRNYQHRKILESFSTPVTQSSLSTYYQNNVDLDTQQMTYHGIDYKSTLIPQWTGSWVSKDKSISCQIVQLNDQLTITFTNNPIDPNNNILSESLECPPNAYIGLSMLNQSKTVFYLISTICDTYNNAVLKPIPGKMSGVLNRKTFTLYQTGKQNITFFLKDKLGTYGTSYNNVFTAATSFFPTDINTVLEEIEPCPNGTSPCSIQYQGVASNTNEREYNSCATSVNSDGICSSDPSCVFYYGQGDVTYNNKTIQKCNLNTQLNGTLGYVSTYALNSLKDNSKSICNIGRIFGSNADFNSCILCYVSNVGNVATLNYQFFGTFQNESSLTVQYDVMNKILNNEHSNFSLKSVREEINSFPMPTSTSSPADKQELINLLSFTNSVYMNNTVGTVETLLSNSLTTTKNIVNSYIATNSNNNLMPAIWQINQSVKSSSALCPFTLSTSSYYNTPVKYVQYNLDGTTNLSLFEDGDNQTFLMDNLNLIGTNNKFALATLNIKTATSLYLIPSQDNNGFSNNSNLVNLSTSPEINGKWFIIGFNLSNISDLNKMMNSNSGSTFYNMITKINNS